MTHIKSRQGTGTSTKLISVRIQVHTVNFAEEYNFALGSFINAALSTYIHDLQTEHNVSYDIYWLTNSGVRFVPYLTDGKGSVQKMVRIRCDLLEYLHVNTYQINTAINLACDRWRMYFKNNRVAQYTIDKITKPHYVPYQLKQ